MMGTCPNCGEEIASAGNRRGRKPQFCAGSRCRVAYHRRVKRYNQLLSLCNDKPDLKGLLILELFPGAGLFGKSFEALGATVVRGPDILWGGDVREFKGTKHKFDGIIGGPPCQFASRAAISGSSKLNLIPEFLRIVEESEPTWAVMENVREARSFAPAWDFVFLRDWDCGGLTHRRRGFWFWKLPAPPAPMMRAGTPEYSVLASNWNKRGTNRIHGHLHLTPAEAARLQGFPGLEQRIRDGQPGFKKNGKWSGVGEYARDVLATHMIGNGVSAALGTYVAGYIAAALMGQLYFEKSGLPLFQPLIKEAI